MKRLISLMIIVCMSVSLSGCSLFTSIFDDKPYGQFTIWTDEECYAYLNDEAKQFMEHNKLIEIEVKLVDSESYIEKYLKKSDNKTSDMPSAVVLKGSSIANVYDENKNALRNVSSEIYDLSSNYTEERMHELKINKNLYGIPLSSCPLILFIDEEKMTKYGYKKEQLKTWDDICTIGADIYKKSQGKEVLFNLRTQESITLFSILIMQLKHNDEKFNLSNNNTTIVHAKEIMEQLKKNNALKISSKSSSSIAGIGTYKDIIKLSAKNSDKKYVISNLPSANAGGNTFVSSEGYNLIVTEQSENISGLIEFIRYLAQEKSAIEGLKQYNIFPAVTNVYTIKLFDKKHSAFNDDKLLARLAAIALREDVVSDRSEIINYVRDNYDSLIGK